MPVMTCDSRIQELSATCPPPLPPEPMARPDSLECMARPPAPDACLRAAVYREVTGSERRLRTGFQGRTAVVVAAVELEVEPIVYLALRIRIVSALTVAE